MSWMLDSLHFKRAGTGKAYTTLLFQGKFRLIEAVYHDIHYANFQNFLARIDLLMRCQVVKFKKILPGSIISFPARALANRYGTSRVVELPINRPTTNLHHMRQQHTLKQGLL